MTITLLFIFFPPSPFLIIGGASGRTGPARPNEGKT